MNKVMLIVPTRGRPDSAKEFYEESKKHSSITDLCFGLDDDDIEYPRIDGVIYEVSPRTRPGMNASLNRIANKYADQYEYLAFMGDDHRIRTLGWDTQMVSAIDDISYGVVYGNDLLQGEELPTEVLMDAKIVRKLGFMAPPNQKHLFLDNFWKDLGNRLGTLRYLPDVIIEHMHYTVGKSQVDESYLQNNDSGLFQEDARLYYEYLATNFESDIQRLIND